jgi:hypothetical protein
MEAVPMKFSEKIARLYKHWKGLPSTGNRDAVVNDLKSAIKIGKNGNK